MQHPSFDAAYRMQSAVPRQLLIDTPPPRALSEAQRAWARQRSSGTSVWVFLLILFPLTVPVVPLSFVWMANGFYGWPAIAVGWVLTSALIFWRLHANMRKSAAATFDRTLHLLTYGRVVSAGVLDIQTFYQSKGRPERVAVLDVEGRTVTWKTKDDALANLFKLGTQVALLFDETTDDMIPAAHLPS